MDIETVGERGVELGQGRIRGGEDEEGSEGVREGEGAEGVKGVRRARSMEVTPSAASDGDE